MSAQRNVPSRTCANAAHAERSEAGVTVADDRLGEPFLRAVLHDTPARLLGLRAR